MQKANGGMKTEKGGEESIEKKVEARRLKDRRFPALEQLRGCPPAGREEHGTR